MILCGRNTNKNLGEPISFKTKWDTTSIEYIQFREVCKWPLWLWQWKKRANHLDDNNNN